MGKKKAKFGLYLNTNHVFSYKNISNFIYVAARGIGKTVIAMETAIILKRKYGYDNVKCYYFRLTDLSIKALLMNDGRLAVDPYLVKKYNLNINVRNNIIYDGDKILCEAFPLVSAGSMGKGVNLYDCNFLPTNESEPKRFVVTIWDEFLMAEGIEKKSIGSPVDQYNIYMEAILRNAERITWYNAVYNFFAANNVSECASVTGALFNYIPHPKNHRRTFLTRKHAMFWNVPVTKEYIEKRKNSYNADIFDYENDPNYTNIEKDMSLIKSKKRKLKKLTGIIKFGKLPNMWFAVYDGIYIKKYNNENYDKAAVTAMVRHLDDVYSTKKVKMVQDFYDMRGYRYADLMSQALFQNRMKLIKNK